MSKIPFMVLGGRFILTVNASLANFCKLWSECRRNHLRQASNVEMWS